MKNLVFVLILAGLISAGLLAPSLGSVLPAQPITLSDILRAHGVSGQATDLTSCAALAGRVAPHDGASLQAKMLDDNMLITFLSRDFEPETQTSTSGTKINHRLHAQIDKSRSSVCSGGMNGSPFGRIDSDPYAWCLAARAGGYG